MTTFIESPRFPDEMAFWSSGGAQYNTTIIQLNSGFEQRNENWSQGRATYSINQGLRTQGSQFAISETIAFFHAMSGRAFGFRFKDFQDFKVNTTNGSLENGIGTGNPTYQLYKNYTTGTLTKKRKIKKPVNNGEVKVYKNSTLQTIGTNLNINFTNGIVTFIPTINKTISSIAVGTSPLVTTSTSHGFTTGQVIYLTNLNTGNTLNNLSFTVTVISPTTFTIDSAVNLALVNTGNAQLYPQASDTLTWEGEFDLACRFDNDELSYDVTDGGLIQITNMKIVEIRT